MRRGEEVDQSSSDGGPAEAARQFIRAGGWVQAAVTPDFFR